MKKITAVIACYKDAQAIPIMYKRLISVFQEIEVAYEIIFVNDSSPDNSEEILAKLAREDKNLIVVNHSRNFGSQMAFTSGMAISSGDCVVLLDGDLQDPPELIGEFYKKWMGGFDVVYGIRANRDTTSIMRILYKLFYRIFQRLSYVKVPLDAGDFSLMDKKIVKILCRMPERDRFIRGLRAWVGFRQTGVPYFRPERMFGRSTNNFLRNFGWARKGIFSFSYVPLEVITYMSLIVVILSLIGIVIQIILKIINPDVPRGVPLTLVVVLFLGSVQLLSLSVLGEYIGKIFEEVKSRPQFIVKSIINGPKRH
ncbi:MAG: glycosyltransferase family 2 protein [Patescibacteria group bacterium]